jgi:ribosomal protein S18 acetylase RimI-like enzyme
MPRNGYARGVRITRGQPHGEAWPTRRSPKLARVEARTVIRRIGASEGPVVKSLRLRSLATDPSSFVSTYAREAAFADDEWTDWATGDASGEEKSTLLAMRVGEPVGLVAAYRDEDERSLFHVVAMWVAPEARREGIGRRLLSEIEDWIASAGGDCVHLSVADQALPALRLYDAAGYEPDGKRSESAHTAGVMLIGLRKELDP